MKQSSVITIFIFFLLLLINDYTGYSQYTYKELLELDKKIRITEAYADSILSTFKKKDALFAKNVHGFSYFFYRERKNYDLAIRYGIIEKNTFEDLRLNNKEYNNILYNLGKIHFLKLNFTEAISYFDKAIKSNKFPKKVAQSYCQMARCYRTLGDYYRSINYYSKGLPLLLKHGSKQSYIAHSALLAATCNTLNTEESVNLGLFYLQKADSLLKSLNNIELRKKQAYTINTNFANLYSLKHNYNYNKAKYYYINNIIQAQKEKNNKELALNFLNLGELYSKNKNDSALIHLKKSLAYDKENLFKFETYKILARLYSLQKDYRNSADYSLKSIYNCLKIKETTDFDNISGRDIINAKEKNSLFQALQLKVTTSINIYEETKESIYLKEAIETVLFTKRAAYTLQQNTTETSSKYIWLEEVSKIFNLGIYAASILENPTLIFRLMEQNKAFILNQNILLKREYLNLPIELKLKNNEFKKSILNLESTIDSLEISKERSIILDLKNRYQNFRDSINLIYPEYLPLDQKIEPVTLEMVKKGLNKNDVVISFSVNNIKIGDEKSSLIGLAITKEKTIPFKIPDSDKTIENLSTYRKLLSSPLKTKEELNEFKSVAYFLYNQLFPTPEIKELIKDKDVLIVPDVSMENTPLEALISKKGSFRYLIEDCNISYAYSLTFSELNKDIIRETSNSISFYSPIKFNNSIISSLPFTEKESNGIENIISGNFLQFDNANKSNFLKNSANSKIIHLATHADASDNPQIQFYDSILPLHELYTYKNNADLVVLSACETNLGEIKKGEGVLSLARGFFHSGANSVVSSLWKINDASTSEIMTDFYKNLKDNQSKTLALNNAKRSYLKNHSLSEKSPYYWASFVLIGDTNPVFESNIVLYISIILTFIVLVFLFLRRKVVKHKKHEAK